MSSANVKRSAGVAALLSAAVIWGFSGEVSSVDGFWPFILGVVLPWLLLLTVALVAITEGNVRLSSALLSGLVLGCFMGMLFVVGWFSPFALQVGGRNVEDFGADGSWSFLLALGLIAGGLAGIVVGPISAVTAWALQLGLGQVRSDRERDKKEATG